MSSSEFADKFIGRAVANLRDRQNALHERVGLLEAGLLSTVRRQAAENRELQRRIDALAAVLLFNEKVQRLTDDGLLHEIRGEKLVWKQNEDGSWYFSVETNE